MASPEVFIFPGQGSQLEGMGQSLETSAAAQEVFVEADEVLQGFEWWAGRRVIDVCLYGPKEILNDTMFAQPAIFTVSVAAWKDLDTSGRKASANSGHSLGEYSALVAAGAIELKDAIGAVAERGRLMHQAAEIRPGGMVAVIGLELSSVEQLCARLVEQTPGANVQVANINSPNQVIIAGDVAALVNAGEYARELGARLVKRLPVTMAGHSELMRPVVADMTHVLDSIFITTPKVAFYSPTTKARVEKPEAIRTLLMAQLTSPVEWVHTIRFMVSYGYRSFREVGPGTILGGLVHDIDPTVDVSATNT